MTTPKLLLILGLWLILAALAVAAGAIQRVPPPLIVITLTTLTLATLLTRPTLRHCIYHCEIRWLLLPHLIRFVGVAFLILVERGTLAPAFIPIGWGDLLAALGALVLLVTPPPRTPRSRLVWLAWNTFGLADMLFLLATGIRLASSDPAQFTLFRQLPLGLLPTFAVPLIISTHILLFLRLRASASVSEPA